MSEKYQPQDGDRVRALADFTGTVERHTYGGFTVIPDDPKRDAWTYDDSEVDKHDWTFEKITPPLPTTPGSVIAFIGSIDSKYVLRNDGKWYSLRWADVLSDLSFLTWENYGVIFDAGKDES